MCMSSLNVIVSTHTHTRTHTRTHTHTHTHTHMHTHTHLQAVQQSQWVIETESKLRLEVLTIDGLKRLLKHAGSMQASRVVEVVTGRVRTLLTAAQEWETDAKTAIKQRSVHIQYQSKKVKVCAVRLRYCAGAVEVRSWYALGALMVRSWFAREFN